MGQLDLAAGTGPDRARVEATLRRTFHTTDGTYRQVIRARLQTMKSALEGDRLQVTCGGSGCAAHGSALVAAYVDSPWAMVLCSRSTGDSSLRTFLHELAHAVIPTIGVVHEGGAERVSDQAYTHERLFRHLTPDEALDNADSYGHLIHELVHRRDVEVATGAEDDIRDCPEPAAVANAMARAERQLRVAISWTHAVASHLEDPTNGMATVADLTHDTRRPLQASFPALSTAADVRSLYRAFQDLRSPMGVSQQITCSERAPSGVLGFTSVGIVTGTGTRRRRRRRAGMTLTPAWSGQPLEVQTRVLFDMVLLGMTSRLRSGDGIPQVDAYARLAGALAAEQFPALTPGAQHHLDHERTRSDREQWYEMSTDYLTSMRTYVQDLRRHGGVGLSTTRVARFVAQATSTYAARPRSVPRGHEPSRELRQVQLRLLLELRLASMEAWRADVRRTPARRADIDARHRRTLAAISAGVRAANQY